MQNRGSFSTCEDDIRAESTYVISCLMDKNASGGELKAHKEKKLQRINGGEVC